jgi:hypothetical protein
MSVNNQVLAKINSTILPAIKSYKVGRNKIWADAGRSGNGTLRATFVGIFPKIEITFIPTNEAQMSTISTLLDNPSFTLEWYDPKTQTVKSGLYYAADFETPLFIKSKGLYNEFSIALIPYSKI